MQFEATQSFDAAANAVFDLFASASVVGTFPQFGKLSIPTLVDRTERDNRIVVRLRYAFVGDLPAAALRVVDRNKLTWIEETTYDPSTMSAKVQLLPDHYGDKLKASASVKFDGVGAGSTRRVVGDLKVRVPLVGGQVERAIVSGLVEHLAEEEHHVANYLASV